MTKITDWDDHIGRRLRLRDLRIFFLVVQSRSISKAAQQLRVSHPAVSQVIADLEHSLGVKLFDRSSRGVEPTPYADALLARGRAAFDELKQGIRDIEFLADPTTGELAIGYTQSIADTVLRRAIEHFSERYPRVIMHAEIVPPPSVTLSGLHDRTHELILTRIPTALLDSDTVTDLSVEVLFYDPWVVVASAGNRPLHRRTIDLVDLLGEPWLLPPPDTFSYQVVADAFKARGLGMPTAILVSHSMDLRAKLSARGRSVTVVPQSMLQLGDDRHGLKKLPVDIPVRPWPVVILRLKNRTLSPLVERFIDCARGVAKSMASKNGQKT